MYDNIYDAAAFVLCIEDGLNKGQICRLFEKLPDCELIPFRVSTGDTSAIGFVSKDSLFKTYGVEEAECYQDVGVMLDMMCEFVRGILSSKDASSTGYSYSMDNGLNLFIGYFKEEEAEHEEHRQYLSSVRTPRGTISAKLVTDPNFSGVEVYVDTEIAALVEYKAREMSIDIIVYEANGDEPVETYAWNSNTCN